MKIDLLIALGILVVGVWAIMEARGGNPPDPYCEMRELWEQTDGEYGWPELSDGEDLWREC